MCDSYEIAYCGDDVGMHLHPIAAGSEFLRRAQTVVQIQPSGLTLYGDASPARLNKPIYPQVVP